jgi:hypothetical protein
MRPSGGQGKWRKLGYLAVAAAALGNAGCLAVAAGAAAAGGVAGYAYYKGSVSREYPALFEQTWAATQAALADLAIPVVSVSHDAGSGVLEARNGGDRMEVSLEAVPSPAPGAGPWTRVSVRVGVFGDRALSERLLDQIQARLTGPAAVAPVPVTGAPVSVSSQEPPVAVPAESGPPPPAVSKQ